MKIRLLSMSFLLASIMSVQSYAANISPEMMAKFKQLPAAQQQALAAQYGVNLDSLDTGTSATSASTTAEVAPTTIQPRQVIRKAGNGLKPFGYNLFAGQPTSLFPTDDLPVPDDYIVGPGDEINIQLFGKENSTFTLRVSRNGSVDFPKLGPISVAGLSFQEVKSELNTRIAKQYIGVESSVTFGAMRTMQIFIMGDAYKPGAYNVNALTSVTQALLVSGGIDTIGSLRNIQVKRNNQVVEHIDLYDMLLSGDTSKDIRLSAGDTIFVSPKGREVSVQGLVKRPAIYEMNSPKTTLQQALALAGGIKSGALNEVSVSRKTETGTRLFNLNLASARDAKFIIKDGDNVSVIAANTENQNIVSLKGAVVHEGVFSYKPGLRISDIIKDKDRDLKLLADLDYALLVREINSKHDIEVYQFSINNVLNRVDSLDDYILQPRDEIVVFNADATSILGKGKNTLTDRNSDRQLVSEQKAVRAEDNKLLDKQTGAVITGEEAKNRDQLTLENVADDTATDRVVDNSRTVLLGSIIERLKAQSSLAQPVQLTEIRGEIKYPGVYPITRGMSLANLIKAAGGFEEPAYQIELSRVDQSAGNINLIHERIDLSLAKSAASPRVLSKDSVNVLPHPEWREEASVEIFGEVKFPGIYTVKRGESLRELINRVGGITQYANPKGTVFAREELRKIENERLAFLRSQLRQEISTLALRRQNATVAYTVPPTEAMALVNQLDNTKAIGRLSINMPDILAGDKQADILLENGDKVYVPSLQNVISIAGQVQYPSSQAFDANFSVNDYIERAGGEKKQADTDRIYVIKADGSVMLPSGNYWFSRKSRSLEPGDTIVVPLDTDYIDSLSSWSTATQMMYQLGVAWSAVK